MKKIVIIIVVAAIVGAIGYSLYSNKKEIDSRKEVVTVNQRISVTTTPAEMRNLSNKLLLVGTAEASQEVVVASESAGKITKINFKLGDYVSKGAVLATVDDTYKRLDLENAQINHDKYKEDYARYQALRKGDAVTETQLRDMRIAYENAVIQVENATKQYNDTRIVAPFSGYITSKDVELGAYVNPGAAIASMANIDPLKVSLSVSESNVYALHTGQEVIINTAVYPGVDFNGKISHISPKGDRAHTYPIEIALNNSKQYPLKAGTYVNINIKLDDDKPALMIPRDAIVSSVKDPSVYQISGDSVKLVKITTGRDNETFLEVLSGLSQGDQVVTNGQINLMDGAKVSILNN